MGRYPPTPPKELKQRVIDGLVTLWKVRAQVNGRELTEEAVTDFRDALLAAPDPGKEGE